MLVSRVVPKPALLCLAAVACTALWTGHAHAHDGTIQWRTLITPHAEVHFPATHRKLAQRTADAFEDGWRTLTPVFNYRPVTPVHITIDDYVDGANGFANPQPYDRIHVRAYPPRWIEDLAGHGDWVRLLVFHELAHLLHLGNHDGLSRYVNAVLGRTYLPNQYLPRLIVEGVAVWAESRHLGYDKRGRGRLDSPQYMAKLRAFVLDNRMPKLAELTGRPLTWPRGNGWYLFGSLLIDHQVRRHGQAKLIRFIRQYGRRPVPYAINALYRRIYGISAVQMWRDAVAELRQRVRREHRLRDHDIVPPKRSDHVLNTPVPTGPPTVNLPSEGTRLTFDGESKGRVRLDPTGRFAVFVSIPNNQLPRIDVLRLSDRRRQTLHVCELGCREPLFSADGLTLHWSEARPWRRLYVFQDLFAAPFDARRLRLGKVIRRSRGMRVREVRKNAVASPIDRESTWDTRDRPSELAPPSVFDGFDRQGKWALVDRGAFRDLSCGGTVVVQNRVGMRTFAVDETRSRVVSVRPHAAGDELYQASLPSNWRQLCARKVAAKMPKTRAKPPISQRLEMPYQPWSSMRPRRWQPVLQLTGELTAANTTVGLTTSGRDALLQHRWTLTAQSDLELEKALVTGSWTLLKWEPTWTLAATWADSWTWFTRGSGLYWLRDRRWIGRVSGAWRYPRGLDAIDLSAGLRVAHYGIRDPLDRFRRPLGGHDPFGPLPNEPFTGVYSLLSAGLAWGRQESYANSVTVERKWRYAAFVSYAPSVLSERPQLRVDLHTDHAWPLGKHRVLQWRNRLGLAQPYEDRGAPLSVSGLPMFDPQALLFGGAGQDFSVVRGFMAPVTPDAKQLRGHVLTWTSLQLHWPVRDIGAGLDTLPFFLGRAWLVGFIDAAATVDVGEAKRKPVPGTGWVASVGAEVRMDIEVGYVSQGALVVGFARAFGDVTSSQWYLRLAP